MVHLTCPSSGQATVQSAPIAVASGLALRGSVRSTVDKSRLPWLFEGHASPTPSDA